MAPVGIMWACIALVVALKVVEGIVVTLTKHQRRVAEIIHQAPSGDEVAQLRQEVGQLMQIVQQHTLALESYRRSTERTEDHHLSRPEEFI